MRTAIQVQGPSNGDRPAAGERSVDAQGAGGHVDGVVVDEEQVFIEGAGTAGAQEGAVVVERSLNAALIEGEQSEVALDVEDLVDRKVDNRALAVVDLASGGSSGIQIEGAIAQSDVAQSDGDVGIGGAAAILRATGPGVAAGDIDLPGAGQRAIAVSKVGRSEE